MGACTHKSGAYTLFIEWGGGGGGYSRHLISRGVWGKVSGELTISVLSCHYPRMHIIIYHFTIISKNLGGLNLAKAPQAPLVSTPLYIQCVGDAYIFSILTLSSL